MNGVEHEIREILDRETRAWDTKDVDLLMTIWHPDMVWPWPRTASSHDPLDWVIGFGRFDEERWRARWAGLFEAYDLVHNRRRIRSILVSPEGDAALAVVDIDTLWRDPDGNESRWKGRVSKVYTKMGDEWKLIMHTGALDYGDAGDLNAAGAP